MRPRTTERAPSQQVDALDVFVSLLSGLDSDPGASSPQFYDRLCEAVCRLTSMRRAALLLYDDTRKLVVPAGSHGMPAGMVQQIYGTLDETPIARRALSEDRVMETAEDLDTELPERYADYPGVTTLTCTPVGAGGRWLGVIFADRGGDRLELTEPERHAMWLLGKTAALAASAQIATTEHEQARQLGAQIELAREVHERVIQRIFGVYLALGSGRELDEEERLRCADEIHGALVDLRTALSRPLGAVAPRRADVTLRGELARLTRHYTRLGVEVSWELDPPLPDELEPIAQSVLAEALRNADRHAEPSFVSVSVGQVDGAYTLEVRNDGVRAGNGSRGTGMGLRLATFEALQCGGVLEFGAGPPGEWHVRLVAPGR